MTCPSYEFLRNAVMKEIETSSDPMTVLNLQRAMAALEQDPVDRGEVPLFGEV